MNTKNKAKVIDIDGDYDLNDKMALQQSENDFTNIHIIEDIKGNTYANINDLIVYLQHQLFKASQDESTANSATSQILIHTISQLLNHKNH